MCVQCLNFLAILFFTYLTLTRNFVIFFPVGYSVLLVLVTATTGLAQDVISAPASQAFAERLFSVCGLLTKGTSNRMEKIFVHNSVAKSEL